MKLITGLMIGAGLTLLGGCADTIDTDVTDGDSTRTQLLIGAGLNGGLDVTTMMFDVTETPCPGGAAISNPQTWWETVDLEALTLGDFPAFDEAPYDADSEHRFADQYFLLPAGCYDVLVAPLDATGAPSGDCYSAHQDGVEVLDGQTTEIVLISQCQGPARGGLDVVATLNQPPQIDDLTFTPSKFIDSCSGSTVCVTVSDPDGDPMEINWSQTSGGAINGPTVTTSTVHSDGSITQCAEVAPNTVGDYEFEVTVFDTAYDENGQIARIEDLLSAQGDAHESRDSLEFPMYSGIDCPTP